MRTNLDAINKVVLTLTGGEISDIFKFTGHSAGEYIVVNSLPIQGDILKICFVNVNIHVPDIAIKNKPSVADTARLEDLAATYTEMLKDINDVSSDTYIEYYKQGIERDDSLKNHYVNIVLKCNLIE